MGWVTLNAISDRRGLVADQPLLVLEYWSDFLSRGIKISAVHCLVLSQSTRVTDGQTELRQLIPR